MADTPQPWSAVHELLEETLRLDPANRQAFLDRTRRERPELLPPIESALGLEETLRPGAEHEDGPSWEGRRLGPYEVLSELGRGGMGAVFLARRVDGEFEQEVAIKVIQKGPLDREAHRRFLDERQILAKLVHPNIARLLDGGTSEEGVPFLVMERIEGERITSYCEAHELSLPRRLDLFTQVCEAVDHAHRNLVAHLDLKPGNILVRPNGRVKLLDFGIAKLLDGKARSPDAGAGSSPLTPRYASPEQILGETVSTSSDVYSLGVILYELLAGVRPYEGKGAKLVLEIIASPGPRPPSQAVTTRTVSARSGERSTGGWLQRWKDAGDSRRGLGFELDRIVLKAMARSPYERYGSPAELAADLRRFQRHEPVTAVSPSMPYRLRKFVRRHRPGVVASFLLILSLAGGLIARSLEAEKAQRERDAARQARDQAEDLVDFMVRDLWQKLEPIGRLDLLSPLAHRLEAYYASRAGDVLSPSEKRRQAASLFALGQVLNDSGDIGGALEALGRHVDLLEESAQGGNPDDLKALVDGLTFLAFVQGNGMLHDEAQATFDRALTLADEGRRQWPGDGELAVLAARLTDEIGVLRYDRGDLPGAAEAFEEALRRLEALGPAASPPGSFEELLGNVELHRGIVFEELGDLNSARASLRVAVELSTIAHREAPDDIHLLLEAVIPRATWSRLERLAGASGAQPPALAELLPRLRAASARDPGHAELRYQLSLALLESAFGHAQSGQAAEARSLFREVLQVTRPFAEEGEFVYILDSRIRALLSLGHIEEARGPAEALLARGWGHQKFAEFCRNYGILPADSD